MELYIILGVIVVLAAVIIAMYNAFIILRNKVDEAYATMDVYLKKRYDLIPNLVETVKGYAAHETETFDKVIQARNKAQGDKNIADREKDENALTGTLKSLFALAESYPELKADGGFVQLQTELETVETDIAQSRKYYNAVVKSFNTKVEVFPSSIIATIMKFSKYQYFMAEETEREAVKVQF